jgi:drug/metabolite transporter (DMT)-like permease
MLKDLKIHGALFAVALIYGANFSIAKIAMPAFIKPDGFIVLRVLAAAILFWIIDAFRPGQKIYRNPAHFKRLIICSIFGVACNMLMFFKGLAITSPINASIIMLCTPLFVALISGLFFGEKFGVLKTTGFVLGLTGALLLIIKPTQINAQSSVLGDFYVTINAISYAVYLVLIKELTTQYRAIYLIKWVFLFGLIWVIPFGFTEMVEVEWTNLPGDVWFSILFVILGTTFLAYLLNGWALKFVQSSLVGAYIYFQPILATLIAYLIGQDSLTIQKVLYGILIFVGVYCINRAQVLQKQKNRA